MIRRRRAQPGPRKMLVVSRVAHKFGDGYGMELVNRSKHSVGFVAIELEGLRRSQLRPDRQTQSKSGRLHDISAFTSHPN